MEPPKIKRIRKTGYERRVIEMAEYTEVYKLADSLSEMCQVDSAGYYGAESIPYVTIEADDDTLERIKHDFFS